MKRSEIDKKYFWKIEDLYKTEDEFYADIKRAESLLDFSSFCGKLGDKNTLLAYFRKTDEVSFIIEKLYVYAMMRVDTDTADASSSKLLALAEKLSVSFSEQTAFDTPELLSLPDGTLENFSIDADFSDYSYSLKTLAKKKKHVLSESEEKILASLGEVTSTFKEIFSKIDNADLPVKPFYHKGEKYLLSHGLYSVLMQSPDRQLRKKAFNAYYDAYISVINTISSNYRGLVKKNVFYAKTRGYEDCLSMALSSEDVEKEVYENLITSVSSSLPLLHKYIALKKKAL